MSTDTPKVMVSGFGVPGSGRARRWQQAHGERRGEGSGAAGYGCHRQVADRSRGDAGGWCRESNWDSWAAVRHSSGFVFSRVAADIKDAVFTLYRVGLSCVRLSEVTLS